jgi:hypothetical protein
MAQPSDYLPYHNSLTGITMLYPSDMKKLERGDDPAVRESIVVMFQKPIPDNSNTIPDTITVSVRSTFLPLGEYTKQQYDLIKMNPNSKIFHLKNTTLAGHDANEISGILVIDEMTGDYMYTYDNFTIIDGRAYRITIYLTDDNEELAKHIFDSFQITS